MNTRLQVDVAIPDYARVALPRQAHLQIDPELVLAVADREVLADAGLIAGVIGSAVAAEEVHRHVLAYGWTESLNRARADEGTSELTLSEPEAAPPASTDVRGVSAVGSDVDESDRSRQAPSLVGGGDDEPLEASDTAPRIIQPLKDLGAITPTVVVVDSPTPSARPHSVGAGSGSSSGLRAPHKGKWIPTGSTDSPRRRRSEQDRETRGLQLVAREAAKLWDATLEDVRKQTGVGADAIDDSGRYYELKAHSRDLPPEVSLEPSEFIRARNERENFILCVVGGLEEGQETVVKLIPDPLDRLPWWTTSDIKLGGLREANAEASASAV